MENIPSRGSSVFAHDIKLLFLPILLFSFRAVTYLWDNGSSAVGYCCQNLLEQGFHYLVGSDTIIQTNLKQKPVKVVHAIFTKRAPK